MFSKGDKNGIALTVPYIATPENCQTNLVQCLCMPAPPAAGLLIIPFDMMLGQRS